MPSRLAARLNAAREYLFVGRDEELALMQTALDAEHPPFFVLYVFGPGGVGKTSLLRAYQRLCRERNLAAHYLDTRDVDPVPEAFMAALGRTLGLSHDGDPLPALANHGERCVLFIDTYEHIAALDDWLRERILPNLTDNVLVVLAGREMPSPRWRTDAGWQRLLHLLPLRNLDGIAGRTYLSRRKIPEEQHETVLSFTHGHPLAMSLVADLQDQQTDATFQPMEATGVIQALLGQFVQNVPDATHRAMLEASALVRFVTEDLLQTMLDTPNVHDLFEWLRNLSFVESGTRGLTLHELTREVLVADLRWRNAEWYDELHLRARRYYTERLKQAGTHFDRMILADYTYLHRNHPLVRPLVKQLQTQWDASGPILPEPAQPSDLPMLIEMVTNHEGAASAALLQHWHDYQPDSVVVYQNQTGQPLGFQMTLRLAETSEAMRAADPAVQHAWTYLETHAPLRKGERASLFRFWMARDTYQDVSPVQSLIFLSHVRHYLNTPGLAFSFLPCRNPSLWAPIFAFAALKRLPDADFEVGEQQYAAFGHDWRTMSPMVWLDRLAEFRPARDTRRQPEIRPDPMIVLSRSDFEEAVRAAFKVYLRPEKLIGNPLLRSRIVVERVSTAAADDADRIDALTRLLEETTETLKANPREARYYHVLYRTYLQPAPSQEKAAEMLDLSFSTFRRYLKRGLDMVTDMLWTQEIGNLNVT